MSTASNNKTTINRKLMQSKLESKKQQIEILLRKKQRIEQNILFLKKSLKKDLNRIAKEQKEFETLADKASTSAALESLLTIADDEQATMESIHQDNPETLELIKEIEPYLDATEGLNPKEFFK